MQECLTLASIGDKRLDSEGMTPAPSWLSYISPAIALVALLLSVASYRRAGPRVRVHARLVKMQAPSGKQDLIIELTLNNAGLATTQITGFYATVQQFVTWRIAQFHSSSILSGEDLPFLLEGQNEGIWRFSIANSVDTTDISVAREKRLIFRAYAEANKPMRYGGLTAASMNPLPSAGLSVTLGSGLQVDTRLGFRRTLQMAKFVRQLPV